MNLEEEMDMNFVSQEDDYDFDLAVEGSSYEKLNRGCMNLEEEMEMKHFSHEHPLKPMMMPSDEYAYEIFGCCAWVYSSSSVDDNQVYVYCCEECDYFIHRACSEIPHEIHHFYHPDHLLKLCVQQDGEVNCFACYNRYYANKLTYRCVECPDFTMDIQCALMPNTLQNSSKSLIHYRHHGHPLTLHQRTDDNDGTHYYCSVCGTPCVVGSVYRCDLCDISYHESCTQIDLPQEIPHYYHPHPLRLTNHRKQVYESQCLACQEYLWSFLLYECLDCTSYMHIHCALLPDKLKQDGCVDHILHFSHGHPLLLCDSGEQICKACKGPCGNPTYGCKRCSYYIHDSCTGLPRQINHPLHPPHLLTLTLIPGGSYDVHAFNCKGCDKANGAFTYDHPEVFCNGCDKSDGEFLAYKCSECNYVLDLNCGGRNPTITSEAHQHVLTLTTCQLGNDSRNCVACRSAIPDGSLYFSCVSSECPAYILHLLCGPLPCTIKDKCHVDPLKLMDAFVEYYNETDEVYCDTCEQLRDPNEPVYYCKECNFITEIKCVMPEVLRCLEGHNGNAKLRTANKTKIWHNGMVFSFQFANIVEEDDIEEIETEREIKYIREKYFELKLDVSYKGLHFFTSEESVHILKIFQEAGALYSLSETILEMSTSKTTGDTDFSWSKLISSIKKHGLRSSSSYAIGEAQNESDISSLVPSHSNEDLGNLMRKLDSFYGGPKFLSVLDREVVIVGIGELMVMKSLASYLKGLLHGHGDFTAKSILEPRLKMLFLNLLCCVVRNMCTTNVREVDERTFRRWWNSLQIVRHVGFEVEFVIDHLARIALALFGRQVRASFAKTKSKIDETYDEVKELKAKLDAKERELETLKLDLISQRKDMEYERSPEMKQCLERESELKWKKAWEGSPVMFRSFWDPSRHHKKQDRSQKRRS